MCLGICITFFGGGLGTRGGGLAWASGLGGSLFPDFWGNGVCEVVA